SGALALLPFAIPSEKYAMADQQPMTANGGTDPYPIPSLDKNGSHNQPAGPNLEPSHIYHFKGQVARSSTFTGMGTDNQGNRIAFGSPTTDYGVMQGDGSRNTARDFHTHMTNAVQGTRATCQLEAQIGVPSIGFSWKSDPLSTSKADFAIMGEEVNGRYYDM